jgi:hypothetical protein
MKQLGDGVYEVPSDSDYNRTYIVNLTGPTAQCTCVHWAIQRNKQAGKGLPPLDCKHVRLVKSSGAVAQAKAEVVAKKDADMQKMIADLTAILED